MSNALALAPQRHCCITLEARIAGRDLSRRPVYGHTLHYIQLNAIIQGRNNRDFDLLTPLLLRDISKCMSVARRHAPLHLASDQSVS